jgi:type III secretion system YscQ/HrcQ family protein
VPILVELPSELGASLVDRVLGGDGQAAHPLGQPLDALSRGVLAYLAARLLGKTDVRLRAVLAESAQASALLDGERVLYWPLGLRLAGQGEVPLRLLAAVSALRALPDPPAHPTLASLDDFADLELLLCAHAASCALTPRELASLSIGDVVVPERCGLAHGPEGFAGEISVHVPGSARTGFHARAGGAEIVLQGVLTQGEAAVTEGKRIVTEKIEVDPQAPALDEVPIELCLELARFSVTLAELRALRPGDVLATGRLIGERATLTASGRPLARGELVDLDGEIGLRVLEVLGR